MHVRQHHGARSPTWWLAAAFGRSVRHSRCAMFADDLSGMYYGARHPMKPQRITMTHHLILGYCLHEHMDVYVRFLRRLCSR